MIYSEVTGRLGADSELKTSKSGNQFVTMRVASNDFVGGENVTTWIRVLWSGERAVKMQEHLKKGSLVSVRGTQRVSLYDTKNGEKAISFDIFADRVDFVGGGSGSTQSNESVTDTGTLKPKVEAPSVAAPQEVQSTSADDLPF